MAAIRGKELYGVSSTETNYEYGVPKKPAVFSRVQLELLAFKATS